MMAGYFEEKLIDMLPPIYREQDINGDLRSFLQVPAASLDEIKELIDHLPDIFDIDICDVRFIPMLAAMVGYQFDPTKNADMQRREIREVIESYRRKGSIPAIKKSLINIGWEGKIDETFHSALRLNKRSIVNGAKLPGHINSLGVYRIESENLVSNLRASLVSHHPAGMKAYFLQWLKTLESMGDVSAIAARLVEIVMIAHLHETFVVKHNRLNSGYKLTYKEKSWGLWRIECHSTLFQDIERAGTCVMRLLARKPSFKLNTGALNSDNLANLWISESKTAFACEVDTGSNHGSLHPNVRTCKRQLNSSRFNHAQPYCHILFRQKDIYAFAQAGFSRAANLYTVLQWPMD